MFIAIPLSDEVKEKFVVVQQKLRKSKTRMKLIGKENLHMTMRFIGDDEPDEWIKKLDSIDVKAFDIVFDKLGVFPNENYVRVFWVGCEPVESLLNIHRVIGEGELVPHVTLARVKSKADEVLLELLEECVEIRAHVDKVLLMNSTLTPEGPKYEVVHEKNL